MFTKFQCLSMSFYLHATTKKKRILCKLCLRKMTEQQLLLIAYYFFCSFLNFNLLHYLFLHTFPYVLHTFFWFVFRTRHKFTQDVCKYIHLSCPCQLIRIALFNCFCVLKIAIDYIGVLNRNNGIKIESFLLEEAM